MAHDNEMLVNLSNTLRTQEKGAIMVAIRTASTHKDQGFSREHSAEILLADFESERVVEAALADVYPQKVAAVTRYAMTVPTSYGEVKEIVEASLANLGPLDFTKALVEGDHAIMRVSNKSAQSLHRLATQAYNGDKTAMTMLHEDLAPWMEEAMYNSVVLAESDPGVVTASDDGSHLVQSNSGTSRVSLSSGQSTSTRFVQGRFGIFGLADEDMIRAAKAVSPYERLKRALR